MALCEAEQHDTGHYYECIPQLLTVAAITRNQYHITMTWLQLMHKTAIVTGAGSGIGAAGTLER